MKSNSGCGRRISLCVSAIVLAGAIQGLRAQQAESGIPVPTIRVNTRMVLVDAVVTDKQGKAVTGLKPEDFVVEENGKKQKIAAFTAPEEAAKSQPAAELPPGIYSNEPQYRNPGGAVTVFVLDAANTPFRDQAYGRLQMLKYVDSQKKANQRMAIFTLTNGLHPLQDFTSDPAVLGAALKRYMPQEPPLGPAGPVPSSSAMGGEIGVPGSAAAERLQAATDAINSFQSIQVAYQLDRRTESTLEAMRGLSRALGGIPGRKEVIWLTAAFPFDLMPEDRNVSEAEAALLQQGVRQTGLGTQAAGSVAETQRLAHREEIRAAAAEMSAAQIALYPVDVRGLASGMELTFNDFAGNRPSMDMPSHAIVTMSNMTSDQETMREIAAQTGGKVYVNQNEIHEGISLALADNQAAYTLGYYPENKKWDGNYRNIKVRVDRERVQVQHRKGYFALDPTQVKGRKTDQDVAEALRQGVPTTQVLFKAQVKPGEKGQARVVFLVDARTLTGADVSGGKKKLDADLYAAVFAQDGKILSSRSTKVARDFPGDVYQQILQQGMMVPLDVEVPGGGTQFRLAVRDNATGNIGSINAPVTH
jgi:VWFA-related protein